MKILFALTLTLCQLASADALKDFSMEDYFSQCGGGTKNMYAQCDSDTVNQETMLQHAKETAANKKKLVIGVFGYENCGGCISVHKNLKSSASGQSIMSSGHSIIFVNAKTKSYRRVKSSYGLSFSGVPHFTIFEPNSDEIWDEKHSSKPSSNSMSYLTHLISEAEKEFQ